MGYPVSVSGRIIKDGDADEDDEDSELVEQVFNNYDEHVEGSITKTSNESVILDNSVERIIPKRSIRDCTW
jgi:hypothetical protein